MRGVQSCENHRDSETGCMSDQGGSYQVYRHYDSPHGAGHSYHTPFEMDQARDYVERECSQGAEGPVRLSFL